MCIKIIYLVQLQFNYIWHITTPSDFPMPCLPAANSLLSTAVVDLWTLLLVKSHTDNALTSHLRGFKLSVCDNMCLRNFSSESNAFQQRKHLYGLLRPKLLTMAPLRPVPRRLGTLCDETWVKSSDSSAKVAGQDGQHKLPCVTSRTLPTDVKDKVSIVHPI